MIKSLFWNLVYRVYTLIFLGLSVSPVIFFTYLLLRSKTVEAENNCIDFMTSYKITKDQILLEYRDRFGCLIKHTWRYKNRKIFFESQKRNEVFFMFISVRVIEYGHHSCETLRLCPPNEIGSSSCGRTPCIALEQRWICLFGIFW